MCPQDSPPPHAQVQEWGLPSVAGLGCRGWREQEDWWEVCVTATAALLSPRSQAAPGCTPAEDAGGVPAGSLGQVRSGEAARRHLPSTGGPRRSPRAGRSTLSGWPPERGSLAHTHPPGRALKNFFLRKLTSREK